MGVSKPNIVAIADSVREAHCADIKDVLDPEAAEIAIEYMTSMSDKITSRILQYLDAVKDFKKEEKK
jgi:hypothetical protein